MPPVAVGLMPCFPFFSITLFSCTLSFPHPLPPSHFSPPPPMPLADHFSSAFLNFRPSLLPTPTTNSIFNFFVFFTSNRSSVSAQNSTAIAFRRRPLQVVFLSKPSSSNLDIVSIHEHSDGSKLFRFGDPAEVAKNAKAKESNTVEDKAETQGKEKEEYARVKVIDEYHESDTVVKTETVEAGDETNTTTISSESIVVVEDENGLKDSSLKGSAEIELLDEEMEDVSSGFGEEKNSLNDSELEDSTEIELLDEETEAMSPGLNVQDTTNLEKSVDEEQTDGLATSLSLVPSLVVDVPDANLFGASFETIVSTEEYAENEHNSVETEVQNDIIQEDNETVVSKDESAENEHNSVETQVQNEIIQEDNETVVSKDESAENEHNSVETQVQNEIIQKDNETVESELVSLQSPSEPAVNPAQVTEDQNFPIGVPHSIPVEASGGNMNNLSQDATVVNENELDINSTEAKLVSNSIIAEGQASEVGTGFSNKIVEDVEESDEVQLPIVSPPMEAEPMLEEPGAETIEKSTEDNGAENLTLNLILGSARTEVDNNVQNGDLIEPSAYEVIGMEFTESAAWSKEILLKDLALSSGAALLPHPSKVLTGGEDAYFIAGQTWMGVADGVCRWSLEGNSPGYFAQELIKTCERLVSDCKGDSVNNPVELLNLSVIETHAPGSSTILIAQFDGQALRVSNVGDSGFIVLRHGTVYKKSSPMSHAFHFPLQVETGEEPSRIAEFYRVELDEGDVIIIATDGLWDNLYDQEISSIVTKSLAAGKDLEEIAELLATKAQLVGGYAYGRSPFADDAQAAGYSGCTGGKLDDVAVILSLVQRRQPEMTSQSSH